MLLAKPTLGVGAPGAGVGASCSLLGGLFLLEVDLVIRRTAPLTSAAGASGWLRILSEWVGPSLPDLVCTDIEMRACSMPLEFHLWRKKGTSNVAAG